jgi:NAD-dependent deacetylase
MKKKNVVVLSGAGMSAESGIPTFRDDEKSISMWAERAWPWLKRPKSILGALRLWSDFDALEMASVDGWNKNPDRVFAWYLRAQHLSQMIQPNDGHRTIAGWQDGANVTVVTQNVDDLHERAGSRKVLHLHGNLSEFRCDTCRAVYRETLPAITEFQQEQTPPVCKCGGGIRPAAVWFGENLPDGVLQEAIAAVEVADLLVVVGTSGLVHPAAGLPDYARRGTTIVEVNPKPTALSDRATVSLREKASVGLAGLDVEYGFGKTHSKTPC